MNNNARIKPAFDVLEAPYIKVDDCDYTGGNKWKVKYSGSNAII